LWGLINLAVKKAVWNQVLKVMYYPQRC